MTSRQRFFITFPAIFVIFVASLLTPHCSKAQTGAIRFDRISVEDGLSQSAVLAIL